MLHPRHTLLCCTLGVLAACATAPPASHRTLLPNTPSPETPEAPSCPAGTSGFRLGTLSDHPTRELVRQRGTGVDNYRLESGVWLPNAPLLVNEEFDFGLAMGLGAVGAGLSAGNRKTNNERRALALASFTLPSEAQVALERLRQCGLHRWGVLWGGAKPMLLVVSDRFDAQGKLVETTAVEMPENSFDRASTWTGDPSPRAAPYSANDRAD